MVAQATVNGCEPIPSAAEGVSKNLGEFVGDVISLGEMQAQLVAIDAREAATKSVMPSLCGIGGLAFAVGSVPILLLAIGWCLIERAGFPADLAFLTSFTIGILVAAGLAVFAWQRMKEVAPIATRSADELSQNLRWIKHALQKRRKMPGE